MVLLDTVMVLFGDGSLTFSNADPVISRGIIRIADAQQQVFGRASRRALAQSHRAVVAGVSTTLPA